MKLTKAMAITSALALGSAIAMANQPVDARLDFVSNNLTFAAQQLVNAVRIGQGAEAHITADAETLYDAAEHFKEEVELGPEDLDVDFQTISETFDEMRNELRNSEVIRCDRQARTAWFNTEESWIRLRQAWLAHSEPGGGGDGDHQPYPGYNPGGNGGYHPERPGRPGYYPHRG